MKTTNRKDDLLKELQDINHKEIKDKVDKIGYTVTHEQKAHTWVMKGDFIVKFLMALAVVASFVHIVYTGNVDAMSGVNKINGVSAQGNFQLLSVVGPLFGMVLSYYFGKSKASANGE